MSSPGLILRTSIPSISLVSQSLRSLPGHVRVNTGPILPVTLFTSCCPEPWRRLYSLYERAAFDISHLAVSETLYLLDVVSRCNRLVHSGPATSEPELKELYIVPRVL